MPPILYSWMTYTELEGLHLHINSKPCKYAYENYCAYTVYKVRRIGRGVQETPGKLIGSQIRYK
jgi:hypothetical protein